MSQITYENGRHLSDPIPTKFFPSEYETLRDAANKTGLSRSEIIRRAVRLLGRQGRVVNGYGFVLDLTNAA